MSQTINLEIFQGNRTLTLSQEEIRVIEAVSPTVDAERTEDGVQITVHDLHGTETVNLYDGTDGVGISSAVLNADYTLTLTFTDGSSYTTPSIRGAQGQPGQTGVGISSAVLNADYTLTLTFTDGSSYTTPSIRGTQGERGPIGPTPDISIGTVTTGAAGSQAEATMTGTPERPVLNLTIPRGDPGEVTRAELDALAEDVARNTEKIDDLDEDLTQQKSAIDDLQDLTNRKAGMLVDTASGAIASFVPDSTIPDLLGVSVAVEPVQDLHGQDAPWPAGGGKNKFPLTIDLHDSVYTTIYRLNDYPVLSNLFAFLNANIGSSVIWSAAVTGTPSGIAIGSLSVVSSGGTFRIAPNESATIPNYDYSTATYIVIYGSGNGSTIKECQLELGTVKTSFSPYSNICPISGWDSVEVERAGKNLCDGVFPHLVSLVDSNQNTQVLSGVGTCLIAHVVEGQTYTFSNANINRRLISYWDELPNVGDKSSVFQNLVSGQTFTALKTGIALIYIYNASADTSTAQVELGTTASAFKPYAGNTYDIQLGQTVYGGTLDATAGTLTVDSRYFVADGTNITTNGGYGASGANWLPCIVLTSDSRATVFTTGNILADSLQTTESIQSIENSICIGNNGAVIVLHIGTMQGTDGTHGYNSAAEVHTAVKAYLQSTPIGIWYRLATPITITLDPVTIAAIANQTNNVWADAGDVDVTYAADIKTYIDSKIAAAVAAMS